MCKVSVIMPVYNAEDFLRQCLDSLVAQTLKEFEVICVDDGSEDSSCAILEEYSKKDSRFVVIRQENTGAGAARNNGFSHAKGEYVVFLDCDDFFAKDFLEKTWKAGKEKQADVVLFDGRKYDNQTGKYGPEHAYLRQSYLPNKDVFSGDDAPSKIFVITSPAPWLRLVRADFIREKKIEYQNLPNSNDYFFTQMTMAEAKRICTVQEDFVFYRVNNAGSLQGKRTKFNLCFAEAVEALYDELNARGLYEKYRISFIHSAIGCFNDKIRSTNSVDAREGIFRYMLSEDFQRMDLLGHDVQYYGGNWLYNLANDQFELLNWYNRHNTQAEVKKTKVLVPRKSKLRPLVSVIIPMYNVEEFLDETLDSISKQTLPNIEIICVNDGSSDGTLDKVVAYAKKEPRMVVLSHQNSGLSATRNAGLEQAKGKYIYFFDGDDVLDENALRELSTLMERNNLDMALFDADVVSDDAEAAKRFVYTRSMQYDGVFTGPEMYTTLKKKGEYYSSAVMFMLRMEFIRKNNLRFHRAIIHEDQPFTLTTMMLAERVGHIRKPFYKRRVHADSIMTRKVAFANVHGLFMGYLDMSAALANNADRLTGEQYRAFAEHTAGVLATMQKNYGELSSAQQFCRFTLGQYEPVFRNLAVKSFDESTKMKREIALKDASEQKLQKQVQELTKQNRQLSDTANKLNAQLKAAPAAAQPAVPAAAIAVQPGSVSKIARAGVNKVKLNRVQIQTTSGSGVKRLIKKFIPVTYNRSAFESQVVADLVSAQTTEILKQQAVLDNNQRYLEDMIGQLDRDHAARVGSIAAQQEKAFQQLRAKQQESTAKVAALDNKLNASAAMQEKQHKQMQDSVADASNKAAENANELRQTVAAMHKQLQEGVANAANKTAENAAELKQTVVDMHQQLQDSVANVAENTAKKLQDSIASAAAKAAENTGEMKQSFADMQQLLQDGVANSADKTADKIDQKTAELMQSVDLMQQKLQNSIEKAENQLRSQIIDKADALTGKVDATANQQAQKLDMLAMKQDLFLTKQETQQEKLNANVDTLLERFENEYAALNRKLDAVTERVASVMENARQQQKRETEALLAAIQQLAGKWNEQDAKLSSWKNEHAKHVQDMLEYKAASASGMAQLQEQVTSLGQHVYHRIAFDNFHINRSSFSCDVESSKRGKKERIRFSITPAVNGLNNDAIACALATLCGQGYANVYLDIPITEKTKSELISFTRAEWITKGILLEDEQGEEKKGIVLNFSGGYDSLAARALLPEDTQLVAMEFGGWFEREADFFKRFAPWTVKTNFRQLGFDRESWTFMGCGAMLVGKALNAKYNVFGNILEASDKHMSCSDTFISDDARLPFATAGMQDVKVVMGLTEVGTAIIITHYYPEYVNESLKSLAAKGSEKLYRKQVLTEIVRNKFRRDMEPVEFDVPNADKVAMPFGKNLALDFLALYELKHVGVETVSHTVKDIPQEAIDLAQRLTLRFYERAHPAYMQSIPEELRQGCVEKMHAAGVVEYDDQDWMEFQQVKRFLSRWHQGLAETV